jgi:hypothetical protein
MGKRSISASSPIPREIREFIFPELCLCGGNGRKLVSLAYKEELLFVNQEKMAQ